MNNSRRDALNVQTNPTKRFYKWDSTNKQFTYYDKEKKENVPAGLPFCFVLLDRPLICVNGYNEPANCGITSNEVRSVKDEIVVRMFDNAKTVIAKGGWNDIKDACVAKGGKYHLSIYGYDLATDEIVNVSVKGMGVGEWGDFFRKNSRRTIDEIVVVKAFKEGKKGSVKFTYPTFSLERSLSDAENEKVEQAYATLRSYLDGYLAKGASAETATESVAQEDYATDTDPIDF